MKIVTEPKQAFRPITFTIESEAELEGILMLLEGTNANKAFHAEKDEIYGQLRRALREHQS
jgi:hypothetical protein